MTITQQDLFYVAGPDEAFIYKTIALALLPSGRLPLSYLFAHLRPHYIDEDGEDCLWSYARIYCAVNTLRSLGAIDEVDLSSGAHLAPTEEGDRLYRPHLLQEATA